MKPRRKAKPTGELTAQETAELFAKANFGTLERARECHEQKWLVDFVRSHKGRLPDWVSGEIAFDVLTCIRAGRTDYLHALIEAIELADGAWQSRLDRLLLNTCFPNTKQNAARLVRRGLGFKQSKLFTARELFQKAIAASVLSPETDFAFFFQVLDRLQIRTKPDKVGRKSKL